MFLAFVFTYASLLPNIWFLLTRYDLTTSMSHQYAAWHHYLRPLKGLSLGLCKTSRRPTFRVLDGDYVEATYVKGLEVLL
jgi:hypothetical protein